MKEKYPKLSDAELWEKIAIIDSENGSGELYINDVKAGIPIKVYNAVTIEPPFTPEKYIEAIQLCSKNNIEVCIIDSTSHLWAGSGGLLEKKGNIEKRQGFNSYTAWREVTPDHNRFVDTMLQTDIHIIATMRSKQDYVQEKDESGNTRVRKIGLNPVQRDGMEYEFTAFLEIDAEHNAFGSKDRTGIVDQKYFKITPDVGMEFMRWLESGVDVSTPPKVIAESKPETKEPTPEDRLANGIKMIDELIAQLKLKKVAGELISNAIKEHYTNSKGKPSNNYNSIKDVDVATKVYKALKELTKKPEDK